MSLLTSETETGNRHTKR